MFIAKRCNIVRKGFVFYIHSVDQTKCNIEGLKSANWELFTNSFDDVMDFFMQLPAKPHISSAFEKSNPIESVLLKEAFDKIKDIC